MILTTPVHDINQKILTEKVYFQNFSYSNICVQVTYDMCMGIAPY